MKERLAKWVAYLDRSPLWRGITIIVWDSDDLLAGVRLAPEKQQVQIDMHKMWAVIIKNFQIKLSFF